MSDIEATSAASLDTGTEGPYNLRQSLEAEAARQMGDDSGEGGDDFVVPRPDGRDDKGRFAPKDKAEDGRNDQRDSASDGRDPRASDRDGDGKPANMGDQAATETAPVAVAPPPGWSVASKATWNDLPEAVKADIAKREKEVSDGFAQYKGLGELKPFAEAYERQGGSIKQAFEGYMNMDRTLQTNFVSGIQAICQHYNVDPGKLAAVLGGQGQAQQADDPFAARLSPLEREIQMLKSEREADRRAAVEHEQKSAEDTIEQFAADPKNLYFANVKATMGHLIQTGQAADLQDAYDKAIWANPEIRPLLIKQQTAAPGPSQIEQRQAAAAQARQSARSVTGSPAPGGSSAALASKPRSIREIAEDAARAQGISV